MDYISGLSILKTYAEHKSWYSEFLVFESRLQENIHSENLYGSSEQSRVDRAKIIDQLNRLAYKQCGISFNDLCKRAQNHHPPVVSLPHTNAEERDITPMKHEGGAVQTPAVQENSPQPRRFRAFIGYSPEDSSYLEELHSHLAYHVRTGEINFWDETKIRPGTNRREEIASALRSARVAVLLVSADFLASDSIATQVLPPLLTGAKQGEIKILSVILRMCAFPETELAQFNAVNNLLTPLSEMSKGRRAVFWTKVVELMRNTL